MQNESIIYWLRQDLRLTDNPALAAAVQSGRLIIPCYIWSPEEEGEWAPGGASRWWLHQSLTALSRSLQEKGSRLVVRQGPTLATIRSLLGETGATAVYWNRRYEPPVIDRDRRIKENLQQSGCEAKSFNSALLHEPWTIQNKSGKPFQVFTPFWKHCLSLPDPPEPLAEPSGIPAPATWPRSVEIRELGLKPVIPWAEGMQRAWQPGEAGARRLLSEFSKEAFRFYSQERNRPDRKGTSRLSPHLHFGEISPGQIWHGLKMLAAENEGAMEAIMRQSQYLAEIGWREFSHHLLYHFPETPVQPLREEFRHFAWAKQPQQLKAWQKGRTGYPIVDAGMRELWVTGWMHNRVRMIVASFLTKDLRIAWLEGARWFWDTLVDADLAQNTQGWQWTAGCGADAAPFFRVFNPVTQGEKFDPEGSYVKRWLPELAKMPPSWIHKPWEAPDDILETAGVKLGKTYPAPIIDHNQARTEALQAFELAKQKAQNMTTPNST